MSLSLHADNSQSLFWAQLLAYGWSTLGWAELETNDLATAETYLRAAWRLSHDRNSGYLLGRTLEAKGNKTAAVHQYELAHVTTVQNPLGGFLGSTYNVDELLAASYLKLTGKALNATAFNRGVYNGSLQAELDKETEIRPLVRTTNLTGSGLYSVAFEEGKPANVTFIGGDTGFASLGPTLRAHAFPAVLPAGSKAQLLREVRIVCSPYAGCDAYLLLPTAVERPSRSITVNVAPPNTSPNTKTVRTVNLPVQ